MTLYCVVCRAEIPPERVRRRAITCSKECFKEKRAQSLRAAKERRKRAVERAMRQRSKRAVFPAHEGGMRGVIGTVICGIDHGWGMAISTETAAATATGNPEEENSNPGIVVCCAKSGKAENCAPVADGEPPAEAVNPVGETVQSASEKGYPNRPNGASTGNSQATIEEDWAMCKAFSCLVSVGRKVTWKFGVDSHSSLVEMAGYKDQTADPAQMTFARAEIVPDNGDYLFPDNWTLKVDESIRPAWFSHEHEESCRAAHKRWLARLDKILVRKKIAHPFRVAAPGEITKKHLALLRKWDSAWASVGDSVWDSVWASVGTSVGDSVGTSVRDSVWDSVGASVSASVRDSVWDSVRDSVWDSAWAYSGSFFRLPKWKYVKHPRGRYPFGPSVKLWETGLVPSFDRKTWRLHGSPKGDGRCKVLFEVSAEELRKK